MPARAPAARSSVASSLRARARTSRRSASAWAISVFASGTAAVAGAYDSAGSGVTSSRSGSRPIASASEIRFCVSEARAALMALSTLDARARARSVSTRAMSPICTA